jgi:hypothetical protein
MKMQYHRWSSQIIGDMVKLLVMIKPALPGKTPHQRLWSRLTAG